MEQGKTFGSYFLFLIREGLFRLRRELWGWRGALALLIAGYLLIDLMGAMESDRVTMGQGIAVIWLVVLFPPRMGKLLYLLPFSKKERSHYLLMYLFTYLVFQIFVFLLIGAGACLISGYSYLEWLLFFALCTFPFLLLYSGTTVHSVAVQKEAKDAFFLVTPFYGTGDWNREDPVAEIRKDCQGKNEQRKKKRSELTKEEWSLRKKELWFLTVTVVGVLVTVIQVYVCPTFFGNRWLTSCAFWVGAILAYACSLMTVLTHWNRAWEEINKKGSVGKEEGECNS